MYKYPRFALVDNKRYPINTDFRVALECNRIAESDDISDEERSLAIIYLLFGEEGLDNPKHWNGLIEKALKYLKCGKEDIEDDDKEEVNMDFEQDWEYIRTSFFMIIKLI